MDHKTPFYLNSMEFWSHDDLGGMPPKVYKAQFYTHYFRRRFHDCKMAGCKSKMDWDPSKMKKHFMQNHPGIKLRTYYENYVAKNQVQLSGIFSNSMCSNDFISFTVSSEARIPGYL